MVCCGGGRKAEEEGSGSTKSESHKVGSPTRAYLCTVLASLCGSFPIGFMLAFCFHARVAIDLFMKVSLSGDDPHKEVPEEDVLSMRSWNTILFLLSLAFGALISGIPSNMMGRSKTFGLMGIGAVAGYLLLLIACSYLNCSMMIFGSAVLGLFLGISFTSQLIFINEIAPMEIRGRLAALSCLVMGMGGLLGTALSDSPPQEKCSWGNLLILPMFLQIVGCFACFWMPESARYLALIKIDREQALESLQFYHPKGRNVQVILLRIYAERLSEGIHENFIGYFIEDKGRKQFAFAIFLMGLLYAFAGSAVSVSFLAEFSPTEEDLYFLGHKHVGTFYALARVLGNLAAIFLIEKMSRKLFLFQGAWLVFLCLTCVGVFWQLQVSDTFPWFARRAMINAAVAQSFFKGFAIGPIVFTLPFELVSTKFRASAMSCLLVPWMFLFQLLLNFIGISAAHSLGPVCIILVIVIPGVFIAWGISRWLPGSVPSPHSGNTPKVHVIHPN